MKPILDRVMIEQDASPEMVRGILVPIKAREETPRGTVIATGPKCVSLSIGDRVLFNTKWKMDLRDNGKDYVVINEPDVIAVLTNG